VKITLEPEDVRKIKNVAHDCIGLALTTDQVLKICSDNPDYIAEVAHWGANDTEVRSLLANILAKEIMNSDWPLYRDKRVGWIEEFSKAAEKAGYALVDNR